MNLSEGSAKPTAKDRARFYYIAFGSLRECRTIFDLARIDRNAKIQRDADALGGMLYKLCKSQST